MAALARRYGITGLTEGRDLPVIGTKELIAWLPTLLGLGAANVVVVPELVASHLRRRCPSAGAQVLRSDSLTALGPQSPALVYLNSPVTRPDGAPGFTGEGGRMGERGVLVASDECYLGLSWDAQPLSVLHPSVCDGDHTGLLAVHSLSKTSSLAGVDPAALSPVMRAWLPSCWRCANTPG